MAVRRTIQLLALVGLSIVFAAGCASSRKVAFRRHLDAVVVATPITADTDILPVASVTEP